MNRRKLFSTGFAGLAAGAIGTVASQAQAAQNAKAQTKTYDVVVIGCGCAGLSAAIEAADKGAKAIVLEKQPIPLGNTIFAGGNFNATCTWVQKRDGITDTVDAFYKDMMEVSRHRGDPVLTRMFCEQSAEVVQWITDRFHMQWKPIDFQIAPMLGRCHEVTGEMQPGGAQLLKNMMEEAEKAGVEIAFETKAVELIRDEMLNCLGVKAIGEDGPVNYMAKGGVVLCTGGFHNNKDMVTRYMGGAAAWMPLRGSTCLTGENITLTAPFFTQNVNMDQYHCGPIYGPTGTNPLNIVNNGVCVSADKTERFTDEGKTYVQMSRDTAAMTKGNWAFMIVDQDTHDMKKLANDWESYARNKAPVFQADTIEELAKKAGLDPKKLVAVIDEYNKACKNNTRDKLTPPNSLSEARPVIKAPFYAVPFQGGMTATFGGPLINTRGQVLDTENNVIRGLFAIGNAAGGLFYDDYVGGAQLTSAAVFGIAVADFMKARMA